MPIPERSGRVCVSRTAEVRWHTIRWVSEEPQPGWVEVRMTDAFGREWIFLDKPAIFGGDAEPFRSPSLTTALKTSSSDQRTRARATRW
jgi:hypothetical protein